MESESVSSSSSQRIPSFNSLAYREWKYMFETCLAHFTSETGVPWTPVPAAVVLGPHPTPIQRAQQAATEKRISEWNLAERKCYASLIQSVSADKHALSVVLSYRVSRNDLAPHENPRTLEALQVLDTTYAPVNERVLDMRRKDLDGLKVLPLEPLGTSFLGRTKAAFAAYSLQGGVLTDSQRIRYIEDCFYRSPESVLKSQQTLMRHLPQILGGDVWSSNDVIAANKQLS